MDGLVLLQAHISVCVFSIDKTLQDIERKNDVNVRWKESDRVFQETRQHIPTKKQKAELSQIRSKVVLIEPEI